MVSAAVVIKVFCAIVIVASTPLASVMYSTPVSVAVEMPVPVVSMLMFSVSAVPAPKLIVPVTVVIAPVLTVSSRVPVPVTFCAFAPKVKTLRSAFAST